MSDPIDEFWRWFVAHDEAVQEAYDSGNTSWLEAELSPRVKRIVSGTNWEIGPYALPDNAFVLSPCGRDDISALKDAIARAPPVRGWKFIACKPPKELSSLVFEMGGVSTNADSWVYRMTSYNEGEFVDLEIFFEPAAAPPLGRELTLCELVVEALLGEELRLERVGTIAPALVPDVTTTENTTPMEHLRPHLLGVLKPCAQGV